MENETEVLRLCEIYQPDGDCDKCPIRKELLKEQETE